MKTDKNSNSGTARLKDLQAKYRELEPNIQDPGVKRVLSVMYGMLQETWRRMESQENGSSMDTSIDEILNLYKNAPAMEGRAMNTPLEAGTQAPDFELKDASGKKVKLSGFKGSYVMLVFYPLDWSPGCSQQLDLYQSEMEEFIKRKVKIIGISVDSIYSHGAWAAVRNITIPILSDFNPRGEIARKYHVYRESDGFSERAIFILDPTGKIKYSYVSPQLHHIPVIYDLFKKLDEIIKPAITV